MSDVSDVLAGYLEGRVDAAQVVAAVTAAYYGDGGRGQGQRLRPLMELIERVSPGAVALSRTDRGAGFAITPGSRAFPKEYEAELRSLAEAVLGGARPSPGWLARIAAAIRRLFR